MSRAVDGTRRKDHRKKILKLAKRLLGAQHSNFKVAKDAVGRDFYAYAIGRDRKGDFRRLWIVRITRLSGRGDLLFPLINGLLKAGVVLDRKPSRTSPCRIGAFMVVVAKRSGVRGVAM
jgi:large subunit ribosomal protein L20